MRRVHFAVWGFVRAIQLPHSATVRYNTVIAAVTLAVFFPGTQALSQDFQLPEDYAIDIQLGMSQRPFVMGTSTEILNTPYNAVGDEVFRNLVKNSGYTQTYPWKLTLVNNTIPNAEGGPGGQVYVEGGMLPLIGEDKGLWAAVLSHETAHSGERHWVKIYLQMEYNERMIQYYKDLANAGDRAAPFALAAFKISSDLLMKKMKR